jgi:hypothetical protein
MYCSQILASLIRSLWNRKAFKLDSWTKNLIAYCLSTQYLLGDERVGKKLDS